jgi:two-component system chemotaxis response regulator CheB
MYGKGATILAESPETCVVYGMPRAVAEAGIVHRQLPLYQIAGALKEMVSE